MESQYETALAFNKSGLVQDNSIPLSNFQSDPKFIKSGQIRLLRNVQKPSQITNNCHLYQRTYNNQPQNNNVSSSQIHPLNDINLLDGLQQALNTTNSSIKIKQKLHERKQCNSNQHQMIESLKQNFQKSQKSRLKQSQIPFKTNRQNLQIKIRDKGLKGANFESNIADGAKQGKNRAKLLKLLNQIPKYVKKPHEIPNLYQSRSVERHIGQNEEQSYFGREYIAAKDGHLLFDFKKKSQSNSSLANIFANTANLNRGAAPVGGGSRILAKNANNTYRIQTCGADFQSNPRNRIKVIFKGQQNNQGQTPCLGTTTRSVENSTQEDINGMRQSRREILSTKTFSTHESRGKCQNLHSQIFVRSQKRNTNATTQGNLKLKNSNRLSTSRGKYMTSMNPSLSTTHKNNGFSNYQTQNHRQPAARSSPLKQHNERNSFSQEKLSTKTAGDLCEGLLENIRQIPGENRPNSYLIQSLLHQKSMKNNIFVPQQMSFVNTVAQQIAIFGSERSNSQSQSPQNSQKSPKIGPFKSRQSLIELIASKQLQNDLTNLKTDSCRSVDKIKEQALYDQFGDGSQSHEKSFETTQTADLPPNSKKNQIDSDQLDKFQQQLTTSQDDKRLFVSSKGGPVFSQLVQKGKLQQQNGTQSIITNQTSRQTTLLAKHLPLPQNATASFQQAHHQHKVPLMTIKDSEQHSSGAEDASEEKDSPGNNSSTVLKIQHDAKLSANHFDSFILGEEQRATKIVDDNLTSSRGGLACNQDIAANLGQNYQQLNTSEKKKMKTSEPMQLQMQKDVDQIDKPRKEHLIELKSMKEQSSFGKVHPKSAMKRPFRNHVTNEVKKVGKMQANHQQTSGFCQGRGKKNSFCDSTLLLIGGIGTSELDYQKNRVVMMQQNADNIQASSILGSLSQSLIDINQAKIGARLGKTHQNWKVPDFNSLSNRERATNLAYKGSYRALYRPISHQKSALRQSFMERQQSNNDTLNIKMTKMAHQNQEIGSKVQKPLDDSILDIQKAQIIQRESKNFQTIQSPLKKLRPKTKEEKSQNWAKPIERDDKATVDKTQVGLILQSKLNQQGSFSQAIKVLQESSSKSLDPAAPQLITSQQEAAQDKKNPKNIQPHAKIIDQIKTAKTKKEVEVGVDINQKAKKNSAAEIEFNSPAAGTSMVDHLARRVHAETLVGSPSNDGSGSAAINHMDTLKRTSFNNQHLLNNDEETATTFLVQQRKLSFEKNRTQKIGATEMNQPLNERSKIVGEPFASSKQINEAQKMSTQLIQDDPSNMQQRVLLTIDKENEQAKHNTTTKTTTQQSQPQPQLLSSEKRVKSKSPSYKNLENALIKTIQRQLTIKVNQKSKQSQMQQRQGMGGASSNNDDRSLQMFERSQNAYDASVTGEMLTNLSEISILRLQHPKYNNTNKQSSLINDGETPSAKALLLQKLNEEISPNLSQFGKSFVENMQQQQSKQDQRELKEENDQRFTSQNSAQITPPNILLDFVGHIGIEDVKQKSDLLAENSHDMTSNVVTEIELKKDQQLEVTEKLSASEERLKQAIVDKQNWQPILVVQNSNSLKSEHKNLTGSQITQNKKIEPKIEQLFESKETYATFETPDFGQDWQKSNFSSQKLDIVAQNSEKQQCVQNQLALELKGLQQKWIQKHQKGELQRNNQIVNRQRQMDIQTLLIQNSNFNK